ncbi:hypothetical protein ACFLQU_00275 [Verrucomicrobiota bacterium]
MIPLDYSYCALLTADRGPFRRDRLEHDRVLGRHQPVPAGAELPVLPLVRKIILHLELAQPELALSLAIMKEEDNGGYDNRCDGYYGQSYGL